MRPQGWKPMSIIRLVRDGRPLILRPSFHGIGDPRWWAGEARATLLWTTDGGIIATWGYEGHEWRAADDRWDLQSGLGFGLIDDDFDGWRHLPGGDLSAILGDVPPVIANAREFDPSPRNRREVALADYHFNLGKAAAK